MTVTRYSTFTPNAADSIELSAPYEPTRVSPGGALSITAGDTQAQQHGGVSRHTVSFDGQAGGSVAATLSRGGASRSVELIPGNPASRTDVHAAIRAGLIEPDGRGGFRDTVTQAEAVRAVEAATGPQKATQAPEVGPAFNPREMEAWNQDIADLDQGFYDSSVSRTIDVALNGGSLDSVAVSLAKSAGMDPVHAATLVTEGAAMYQRAVERDLSRVGITAEERQDFYQWMRESEPGHMRHALQKVAMQHDTSEFVKLGSQWQAARLRQPGRGR